MGAPGRLQEGAGVGKKSTTGNTCRMIGGVAAEGGQRAYAERKI